MVPTYPIFRTPRTKDVKSGHDMKLAGSLRVAGELEDDVHEGVEFVEFKPRAQKRLEKGDMRKPNTVSFSRAIPGENLQRVRTPHS